MDGPGLEELKTAYNSYAVLLDLLSKPISSELVVNSNIVKASIPRLAKKQKVDGELEELLNVTISDLQKYYQKNPYNDDLVKKPLSYQTFESKEDLVRQTAKNSARAVMLEEDRLARLTEIENQLSQISDPDSKCKKLIEIMKGSPIEQLDKLQTVLHRFPQIDEALQKNVNATNFRLPPADPFVKGQKNPVYPPFPQPEIRARPVRTVQNAAAFVQQTFMPQPPVDESNISDKDELKLYRHQISADRAEVSAAAVDSGAGTGLFGTIGRFFNPAAAAPIDESNRSNSEASSEANDNIGNSASRARAISVKNDDGRSSVIAGVNNVNMRTAIGSPSTTTFVSASRSTRKRHSRNQRRNQRGGRTLKERIFGTTTNVASWLLAGNKLTSIGKWLYGDAAIGALATGIVAATAIGFPISWPILAKGMVALGLYGGVQSLVKYSIQQIIIIGYQIPRIPYWAMVVMADRKFGSKLERPVASFSTDYLLNDLVFSHLSLRSMYYNVMHICVCEAAEQVGRIRLTNGKAPPAGFIDRIDFDLVYLAKKLEDLIMTNDSYMGEYLQQSLTFVINQPVRGSDRNPKFQKFDNVRTVWAFLENEIIKNPPQIKLDRDVVLPSPIVYSSESLNIIPYPKYAPHMISRQLVGSFAERKDWLSRTYGREATTKNYTNDAANYQEVVWSILSKKFQEICDPTESSDEHFRDFVRYFRIFYYYFIAQRNRQLIQSGIFAGSLGRLDSFDEKQRLESKLRRFKEENSLNSSEAIQTQEALQEHLRRIDEIMLTGRDRQSFVLGVNKHLIAHKKLKDNITERMGHNDYNMLDAMRNYNYVTTITDKYSLLEILQPDKDLPYNSENGYQSVFFFKKQ
jgi:hypothetical protein